MNIAENIPPPPPSSIAISPSSVVKEICVTWLKPSNNQRDIKRFRLYRRSRVGDHWVVLKTFAENENVYVDKDVDFENTYIYALTSIDAHDTESILSTQIQAELNSRFKIEREERPLKWISGAGAQPSEIKSVYKKFLDDEEPIVARESIVVGPTRNFNEASRKLLVRVKSLDMHEQKEFVINLRNINIRGTD